MKIGVLNDIHGNLPALEAVLTFFREQGCDEIIGTGDVLTIGPDSIECLHRLQSLPLSIWSAAITKGVFSAALARRTLHHAGKGGGASSVGCRSAEPGGPAVAGRRFPGGWNAG